MRSINTIFYQETEERFAFAITDMSYITPRDVKQISAEFLWRKMALVLYHFVVIRGNSKCWVPLHRNNCLSILSIRLRTKQNIVGKPIVSRLWEHMLIMQETNQAPLLLSKNGTVPNNS